MLRSSSSELTASATASRRTLCRTITSADAAWAGIKRLSPVTPDPPAAKSNTTAIKVGVTWDTVNFCEYSFPTPPMLRCSYADNRLSLKALTARAAATMAEILSLSRRTLAANEGS
jgi:hypothetical protein